MHIITAETQKTRSICHNSSSPKKKNLYCNYDKAKDNKYFIQVMPLQRQELCIKTAVDTATAAAQNARSMFNNSSSQ